MYVLERVQSFLTFVSPEHVDEGVLEEGGEDEEDASEHPSVDRLHIRNSEKSRIIYQVNTNK